MHDLALLVTCEHAVNFIPENWQDLFRSCPDVLDSHRSWDTGAFDLAQTLAKDFSAPCFPAKVTRLLIDHNRSPHNRSLWSEFSRELPNEEKTKLLDEYYLPFRLQISRWIAERHTEGTRVIHLSVHSFAPVLDGKVRDVDIGLLYDTDRCDEAFFAEIWKSRLTARHPDLKVRFNVPYRGRSDCHQTAYRSVYRSCDYLGVELEIKQSLVNAQKGWKDLKKLITQSLRDSLGEIATDE